MSDINQPNRMSALQELENLVREYGDPARAAKMYQQRHPGEQLPQAQGPARPQIPPDITQKRFPVDESTYGEYNPQPMPPSVDQLEADVGRIGKPQRPIDIGSLLNPMGKIAKQGDANLAAKRRAQEEEDSRFRFNQTQGGQPY